MKFIYQPGQLNAQTSLTLGDDGIEYADYSSEVIYGSRGQILGRTPLKTAQQRLNESNSEIKEGEEKFIIIEYVDMMKMIPEAQDKTLLGVGQEITEEIWCDALNCLPPEKWKTVNGVEIFRLCEYYTDNITTHYASLRGRFFKAMRRTSDSYAELAEQIFKKISE